MEPRYRLRLYLLTAIILTGFGYLLSRLHEFQILRQGDFQSLVPGNRTVTVREPGIRGEITDRNNIPLARNLRRNVVSFNLDEIINAHKIHFNTNPTLERLSVQSGLPKSKSEKDIVAIVNESVIKPLERLGLAKDYNASALRTHYLTHRGLVPFIYRTDLTYDEFAKLAERNLEFPGLTLGMQPQRQYAYGSLASHILGYLKQWEKGDISDKKKQEFDHYVGDEKGIAGVEATMDDYLRGPEGSKTILKDEKGRTLGILDHTKPGIGARVELAIDARIQYLLENNLRRAGRASGVVMDVKTGEILAMASVPDFNPNFFVPSISQKRLLDYNSIPQLSPFTNRAISSFEPGSTMKIPTAISGSMNGLAKRSFSCDGYVSYGKNKIGCWIWNKNRGAHGLLNLTQAIKVSCNPYFIKMANTMGTKAMVEGCTLLGFGKKTGIELPNENPGMLPGSRAWRSARSEAVMTPALTGMMSIGQGDMLATPIQMAAMVSAVANGGKYLKPRIVKRVIAQNGRILVPDVPEVRLDLLESGVKEIDLEQIRLGMRKAVNESGGTAGKAKLEEVVIAGKTGTSQTTDNGQKSNNSWLISFAPFSEPRYAVVILVQAGGSGGGVCGPLVHSVYKGIFAQEAGVRLPLKPQTEYVGHLKRIEVIEPEAEQVPEELLGETGDEVSDIFQETPIIPLLEADSPKPTITEDTDREGQVAPRAKPISQ